LGGAFVNSEPEFPQSTGSSWTPAGRVLAGVYSSGAVGLQVPDDVIGLIRYARSSSARRDQGARQA
jgi:hypothetical protein